MPEPQQGASYSATEPTANEALVDSAIYHGLSLERVSSGMKQKIAGLLQDAQEAISGKLQSGKLTDWQTQKAQQFLGFADKTIANTYDKIDGEIQDDLNGIKKAEIQKQINSVNEAVGVEISPAMSTQQLEAIAKADELLVNGAVMSDWWQKQASNLQHNVLTTVQSGLVQGKSTQDIAAQLRDMMGEDSVTLAQAKALARTAAATVQSAAQQAYYDQNDDIIKGIRWVSTLDDRTTPECMALDGLSWQTPDPDEEGLMEPVGHDVPFPGYPPIHWNCRSTTVPVLKSWQELSKVQLPHVADQSVNDIFKAKLAEQGFDQEAVANIEANQRASMDGAVPEGVTYEDWLRKQSELIQKQILGPARWQLWQDGKVSLLDMVKKDTLEPLSVDELIAAAAQNKAVPPPAPPPEGFHGSSLAERQILTAQMTAEATSGETYATWLNPANGVTVDQTLKYSLNPQEQAQLAGQENLVHLSNTASNGRLLGASDAALWAGQPGFQTAKLVTPSGRLITAKLKAGKTWTEADAKKFAMKIEEAKDEGISDPFAQLRYAFRETGDKMILTQTEPGALKLDSSTMKKVYGPVHEEDKPLSYLEAHTNQLELAKQKDLAAAQADIQQQMKVADQAAQKAAEESQLARAKQAALQQRVAEQRLAVAEQTQKEAAEVVAKQQAELAAAKAAAEQRAAIEAAATREHEQAVAELAALQAQQKEAEELAAKIAKQKKASEAAKKGAATKAKNKAIAAELKKADEQAKAEAVLAEQAAAKAATAALQRAQDALWAAEQDKATADKIKAATEAEKAAAKAQADAIKAQKAQAKKKAAAPVNTHGQMELGLEAKAEIKTNFPADPLALPVVRELGGYTRAQLVQDADGNLWVRKRGASAEHVANEVLFDHLYHIAGVDIPESKLYSTPSGPVKLARYVPDTQILGDYLKSVSPAEKDRILGVVKNQFVPNALFANWDAVGANPQAGFDNILIGKNGKAYMIDTGGAGQYKGTGTITRGKFGPEVGELKTMLDPRINPTTAPIFKGITDQQVVDQSVRIFQVRKELLGATPEPLKSMLAARLDWLDNHVTELVATGKAQMPDLAPPELVQHVAAKPKVPSWAEESELKAITESKVTGFSLWSDKDAIEDANTLAWTEKNSAGQRETVAQIKLTADAMKQLEDLLRPILPTMPTAYQGQAAQPLHGLSSDKYYDKILGGVKTINYHANDASYNQVKVADALAQKANLAQMALTGSAEEKAMAQQYLKVIKQIEDSIAQKPTGKLPTIPGFNQYQPPPPAPKPAPLVPATPAPTLKASTAPLNMVEKTLTNQGEAEQVNSPALRQSLMQKMESVLIDMGEVKARYIPGSANNDQYAFALKGQLELRTAGEATADVMGRLQAGFKQLGIDVTPPTDEYKKAMYLTKNIYFLNKSELPFEVEQILKDKAMSDADRLTKIEQIAKRDFKISIKPNDLRWQGEMPASGDGYRYFTRADMTKQDLAADLKGYLLKHSTSTAMPELIEAFLQSGGEITPTTERLRKGISVGRTGGMSPERDLHTGGASYFFTRLTDSTYASGGHLYWGPETLARLDIYSYSGDQYGNVRDPNITKKRATTVAKYKNFATNSSNESTLKNGSSLFDLKYIGAWNSTERDKILAIFRKHGITQWPDGRSIGDVVLIGGTQMPR